MVLGDKALMKNIILFCALFFVLIACKASEINTENVFPNTPGWTKLLDKCQIRISGNIVKLPLMPPCTQAVNKDGTPKIVEYEGRRVSIVIGHTTDFKYLQSKWEYVKEGDGCSKHSVGISLDDKTTPIEVSKPTGGGILCPNYAIDIKWFWSYEWAKKPKK